MLLGVAIGDSVGAGLEFKSREWIEEHVDFTDYVSTGDGMWAEGFKEGVYTDDTEMTIGLVKALIDAGGDPSKVNEDVLVKYWTAEYHDGKQRLGHGRLGHGSIAGYYEGKHSINEIREWQARREYPGNAPVMRAVPLGFLPPEWMTKVCEVNADATHPHPKGRAASILTARAVRYVVLEHGAPEGIIQACSAGIGLYDRETKDYLEMVDQLPDHKLPEASSLDVLEALCGPQPLKSPFDGSDCLGLNSDAMRTAGCVLYLLKWYTDPLEGLKAAVKMGGFVDSLAAVVLGTLGARYGLEGLNPNLVRNVECREELQTLGQAYGEFIARLCARPWSVTALRTGSKSP